MASRQTPSPATRLVLAVIAALAFGALESVLKGNDAGLRDGIGNLSAPWIVVPLLAAAATSRGRLRRGALVGLLAQLTALSSFYLVNAFVLDLGRHSTAHDIGLTLSVGNLWLRAGLLSGPVFGLIGAWTCRRGSIAVAAAAAAATILEPAAVYLAYVGSNGAFAAGGGKWNGIYAAEAGVGLVSAAVLLRLHRTKENGADAKARRRGD